MTGRVTEAAFQDTVVALAHLRGWTVAHFRPARSATGWRTPVAYNGAGFPDLVLARTDREPLFLEIKSESGRTTPAQRAWLTTLGPNAHLIRPSDWHTLEELLK